MSDEAMPVSKSEHRNDSTTSELEPSNYPSTALVEFEDGVAILYGDHVPRGMEVVPFGFLDSVTRGAVSTAVGNAVGLGNIAAQTVNGVMQAQGLVRLAPETLKALETAAPIVKDGWNLGTLTSGGKFTGSVRWLPATAASTASVVAAMGPAIALMVIQIQLNQIAATAEHNLELTSKVLRVVRQAEWSAVTGFHDTLMRELAHAQEIGQVTDAIFHEVQGYQGDLSAKWDEFEKAVRGHVNDLASKTGHKERQQYLTDHSQAIIADVQALLLAQSSWFVYQSMRAGHLLVTAASNPQDASLLRRVVDKARGLHEKTLDETDGLLDQLAREFAVIGELQGKRTFKIGASARAAKDASQMVERLRDALAAVRGQDGLPQRPPITMPPIMVFEKDVPEELARVLPLRLDADEQLLALADASCDRWNLSLRDAGWVAVTNRRVLVAKQESFRRIGAIDIELNLADLRYVRRPNRGHRAPTIDLITTGGDVTLEFPGWAKRGAARIAADRMGELLASYMHIPDSEVPKLYRQNPQATVQAALHAIGG